MLTARVLLLSCLPMLFLSAAMSAAQKEATPATPLYARANSFGLLFAYSNDSSHILMGYAEQRKILNIGASYSRKLILNRFMNWQYDGEILPVALESDPLTKFVNQQTSPTHNTYTGTLPYTMVTCTPVVNHYNYVVNGVTYTGTQTEYCSGRQWTIGEAISPIGMRWNFLPTHTVQPLLEGHGGYMYSTRPIPISAAGSFNFTFDFGVGIEWYRTPHQSLRFEYRFHHISNHDTATENPGIDNGLFQVSYEFGR